MCLVLLRMGGLWRLRGGLLGGILGVLEGGGMGGWGVSFRGGEFGWDGMDIVVVLGCVDVLLMWWQCYVMAIHVVYQGNGELSLRVIYQC